MDELMERLVLIAIVIIGYMIWRKCHTQKTLNAIQDSINNLNNSGYDIDNCISVPDLSNPCKPSSFFTDFKHKKWFFAGYRQSHSDAYDFSDICDYDVIIRTKGTNLVKGNILKYNPHDYLDCSILKSEKINDDNCEYIEINLQLNNNAKQQVYSKFLMYELQDGEGYIKNSEFACSEDCISRAILLEECLFNILKINMEDSIITQ